MQIITGPVAAQRPGRLNLRLNRRPPTLMKWTDIATDVFQAIVLFALLAGAFLAGCALMLTYRGPVKFGRFNGGPFKGKVNLGAYNVGEMHALLTIAIANPVRRVGGRRGPSWPEGHRAHADVEESQASWHARAAMYALGVGVRMEQRQVTAIVAVPDPAGLVLPPEPAKPAPPPHDPGD